jgi:hypothetical protein
VGHSGGLGEDVGVPEFELLRNLVHEVETYDGPDSARRAWMANLPRIVDELAREWSLELSRPFQPDGCAPG